MDAGSTTFRFFIPYPHEALGGLEGRKTGPKTGFEFFRKGHGYIESKLLQGPENSSITP